MIPRFGDKLITLFLNQQSSRRFLLWWQECVLLVSLFVSSRKIMFILLNFLCQLEYIHFEGDLAFPGRKLGSRKENLSFGNTWLTLKTTLKSKLREGRRAARSPHRAQPLRWLICSFWPATPFDSSAYVAVTFFLSHPLVSISPFLITIS